MFEIIPKNTNINFVGKRKLWMLLSLLFIAASVALFLVKGPNYGIDFSGGAEVQLKFAKPLQMDSLRDTLEKAGFQNLVIQQLGEGAADQYLVKFRGDEAGLQLIGKKIEDTLTAKMPRGDFEVQRLDVVGPQAGSELRKSGFLSMFYTMLCILIYVWIRFDARYSPGAVLALIHDSFITIGVFVLLQKEFTLQIVAAILTIIGYSNNDTIIVYDRIRETLKAYPNRSLEDNINRSINETLSRTLLTSACTLIVVIALMIYGGGVIHEFAFTMCIGIVVGTYSSIFIASPTLIWLTHLQEKREKVANGKSRGAVLGGKTV
ncbi:MAG: protein translocase subunit SecF [Deltaproteobacteria bacterium]|nr:protein translocase subunit SecF [Deltaproteobacteria bacterium]